MPISLSQLIDKKRLDLDIAQKDTSVKGRYSGEWEYVKTQVDKLPYDIVKVLTDNVTAITKTEVKKATRMSCDLKPVYYRDEEYTVEAVVYEKNSEIQRAYYVAFNPVHNVCYIREIIGTFKSLGK